MDCVSKRAMVSNSFTNIIGPSAFIWTAIVDFSGVQWGHVGSMASGPRIFTYRFWSDHAGLYQISSKGFMDITTEPYINQTKYCIICIILCEQVSYIRLDHIIYYYHIYMQSIWGE